MIAMEGLFFLKTHASFNKDLEKYIVKLNFKKLLV